VLRTRGEAVADDRMMYTNILCPPGFCPHSSRKLSPIVTHIRSPHIVISLFIHSVVVHDARLPKLQVGPNVAKRKAGRIGAVSTVDGLMKKEAKALAVDSVHADIKVVMSDLRIKMEMIVSLSVCFARVHC
jgi:hypothetical protein